MIVGGPGSGKSTLARQLGSVTGLPVFHMDMIHHLPGWVARPLAEKVILAHAVEAEERWIFEGGLSATYENRASRADTIVWLDLSLILRFWRVFKRRWQYRGGQTRPDLPENCPEKIDWEFFWWIISSQRAQRQKIVDAIVTAPHAKVVHLRSPGEVAAFLRDQTKSALE